MPSQNKTKNLKLSQWQLNEYPKMIDFNDDNQKIDNAFGDIEQKVTEVVENFDVSEKQIEFVAAITRILPQTGDTLKTVISKITKFLADLKKVAFTGKYNDLTGIPESFPPAAHNHDDRYLGKTEKADNSDKLDGHDSSHFATATQLQEVFRSAVDGKMTHINAINRLYGSDSSLTTTNSHADIVWWWENKVIEKILDSIGKYDVRLNWNPIVTGYEHVYYNYESSSGHSHTHDELVRKILPRFTLSTQKFSKIISQLGDTNKISVQLWHYPKLNEKGENITIELYPIFESNSLQFKQKQDRTFVSNSTVQDKNVVLYAIEK